MDNNQYPHNNYYPYHPSHPSVYPPPPQAPDPSSPHPYPYPPPHGSSHSGPLPGPYPYAYPPTQPTFNQSHSFQYGDSQYGYQHQGAYPPAGRPVGPSRFGMQDSSGSVGVTYPRVDDLMSNLSIFDNRPSAPASPPAPSAHAVPNAPPVSHARFDGYGSFGSSSFSGVPAGHGMGNAPRHESHPSFDGYGSFGNSSFSGAGPNAPRQESHLGYDGYGSSSFSGASAGYAVPDAPPVVRHESHLSYDAHGSSSFSGAPAGYAVPNAPPIVRHESHLSYDGHGSSSFSGAPAGYVVPNAPPVVRHESLVRYDGHGSSSFSGNGYQGSYSGPLTGESPSAFGHSSSFNTQGTQIVPLQNKGSLKVLLLHGNLDMWIHEAKNLPNMDMFHKTIGDMFGSLPGIVTSKIEGKMSTKVTSDPYVTVSVANAVVGRTYVISNNENPVWRQHFHVPVAHYGAEVHFVVKDSDVVGSQLIGIVAIPVEQIYSGEKVEGSFPILNSNGKPCKPGAVLTLSIQYIPIEKLSIYHQGVGAGPDYQGVPGTYFPLRKGGTVTLYQDAHVRDGMLPNFMLDNGMTYVHGQCWRDMFDAIRQARRLIYITGWSVWHKVQLIRDGACASDSKLGELLRVKSQEGVRVLLLVWDDPTSRNILGYKTDGVMSTHDEETRRFFKHSSVKVLLCPRIAGKRHSWMKQRETETIYTHHQKTVIVDADAGYNRRKIIAFVGGLDLCDGRYDSPEHPIFRTLNTLHKDDYHNPTYTGSVVGCPREPWHDLHSKIEGPAAYDVLCNFEERWYKAAKPTGLKKLKVSYDDALLRIDRIPDILGVTDTPCLGENDPEAWHVQIFRSIDSNSVKGFPKDPKDATGKNLVCGKNVLIDMSIQTAYIKAIRAAQHFIYIENQYFIGSSYNWTSHKNLGANNLIPMEIALKIASKIRAHERFAAYIVIPMWPEGVPSGAATQRILYWQAKTMQMMYETIYKALVEVGLQDAYSPQDYLNFFCIGNREVIDGSDASPPPQSPRQANTPEAQSRKSRRFMIYVHSKGMIVDDEYVILGSANINQRSMEGTRDTEIAMGAYQPQYTWARMQSSPHGQIYGYRMSLWAEHTGTVEDCFTQPESIECVRRVRSMGETNWKQFAAEEVTEMRSHLLKYPVEVDRKGKVTSLPGHENFPDVGGKIIGSFLAIQENLTI